MLRSLFVFLRRFGGNLFANVLVGAGLGVVSYAGFTAAILTALAVVQSYFGGVAADMLNVMLMCGVGSALSMIGSALLVRAAIASAGIAIGRKTTGGAT